MFPGTPTTTQEFRWQVLILGSRPHPLGIFLRTALIRHRRTRGKDEGYVPQYSPPGETFPWIQQTSTQSPTNV